MPSLPLDDPDFIRYPFSTYQQLRNEHPIFFWNEGFCWVFMKHCDVKPLLKDERLTPDFRQFEYYDPTHRTVFDELMESGLFGLAPKDHHRIRALATPSLAPRIIEIATPMILDVINETFAVFEGKQIIHFAKEVSFDIPREVVSRLVGVPTKNNSIFKDMATAVIDCADFMLTFEQREKAAERIPAGVALLKELIEERRHQPAKDDFLGTLIRAEEQNNRLTTQEMITLVIALLSAGQEATMDVMNAVVKTFLTHPESIPKALQSDEAFKQAVEEAIRVDYFGKAGAMRFVVEDFEYKGHQLKKGQMVRLHVPSAIMDETVFADPEKFDITRDQKDSITFGYGPHFCIGAGLARLEVRLLAKEFLTKFPQAKIIGDIKYGQHYMIRRIEELNIQLWE